MGSIAVRDARGARWKVKARRLRHGQSSRPRPGPEEDSLRRRLAGVVAPHPLVAADPLRGVPGGWRMPADASDIALRQTWAEFDEHEWAVAQLFRMIGDGLHHLSTPWSDIWRVEAAACGRIRRWAIWEVEGMEAADRAVISTAAALEAGLVPHPPAAVLVEVVDQRPPDRSRRSAGLGRAAGAA